MIAAIAILLIGRYVAIGARNLLRRMMRKSHVEETLVTFVSNVAYSAKDQRRIDIVAGVSYRDDLDKVRRVLESILGEDERILKDPAPTIGVLALADSSINFAVRPWVRTSNDWAVYFDTHEKIKKRFDAEGISIPFPQRDVHLYKVA